MLKLLDDNTIEVQANGKTTHIYLTNEVLEMDSRSVLPIVLAQLNRSLASELTISEAASMLDVHPQTLRNWEASNKLSPSRTEGKHRRYSLDQIQLLKGE